MKRFAVGLMAVACAFTLAGCGGESATSTGDDGKQAQDSADPADTDPTDVESQEAEERAAMSPEDYSARLLSLEDLPSGFALEDEVGFGETEEEPNSPFDSDDSSSETDSSQTECIAGAMTVHSSDLDGVSAARNFEQSNDSSGSFIMTSLSRPEKGSKGLLKDLRKTVDDCQQTVDAEQAESVNIFEPSGNKGEGFCSTAYNGTLSGQGKTVMAECYLAWAGDLLTVHYMAFDSETSLAVEQEAMDGVTGYITDDLLPKALEKADMVAS